MGGNISKSSLALAALGMLCASVMLGIDKIDSNLWVQVLYGCLGLSVVGSGIKNIVKR